MSRRWDVALARFCCVSCMAIMLPAAGARSESPELTACRFEPAGAAKVRAVSDGRSFILEDGREIRLAGIEVPLPPAAGESGPNAEAALAVRAALAAIVVDQTVELRQNGAPADRYGRTLFSHSTLIARRLVETGVRFVNVTWDLFWDRIAIDYDAWDTHTRNFSILRDNKLPHFDQTYTALMEDLEQRGLLDETLVVVMSEMGRTPHVNANGGRDHWTFCYSVLLAGAGIRGGTLYGASDAHAAYVKDRPVSPADICATIYQCLGIDPEMPVHDRSGRPMPVAQGGSPIREILA